MSQIALIHLYQVNDMKVCAYSVEGAIRNYNKYYPRKNISNVRLIDDKIIIPRKLPIEEILENSEDE